MKGDKIMQINWKVRIKNPVWWAEIAAAFFIPVLTALGIGWSEITSWETFFDVLKTAAGSPVIIAAVIVSVWNAVVDPTTKGVCDSARVLGYEKPYCEEEPCEE